MSARAGLALALIANADRGSRGGAAGRISQSVTPTSAIGTANAALPKTATPVATAQSSESQCSRRATSLDCEWRRSTSPRRAGFWRHSISSAAERLAPMPQPSAQNAPHPETKASANSGGVMIAATGTVIAASLPRSISPRVTGAVARNSGASSAESAIQASEPASWPAMTTSVGAKATPAVPVAPPLRQRMPPTGRV
jgi:hypothetical protein